METISLKLNSAPVVTPLLELTTKNVNEVFNNCLAQPTSTTNSQHFEVSGIANTYLLDRRLVTAEEKHILSLLEQLPTEFKDGCSFTNMLQNSKGDWWTGLNTVAEKLLILGLAVDKITYPVKRSLWWSLPSGYPYLKIQ